MSNLEIPNTDDMAIPVDKLSNAESLNDVLDNLVIIVKTQTDNIQRLATALQSVAVALDDRPTRKETRKWARQLPVATFLAILLIFVPVILIGIGNKQNGDAIRSCTTPQGKCAKNSAKSTNGSVCRIENSIYNSIKDLPGIRPLNDPDCP
jgi:hypothetical protein